MNLWPFEDQYKNKALASPLPVDPVEKAELLQGYKDQMGLDLPEEDFQPNPVKRQLAKFSLNNIW